MNVPDIPRSIAAAVEAKSPTKIVRAVTALEHAARLGK